MLTPLDSVVHDQTPRLKRGGYSGTALSKWLHGTQKERKKWLKQPKVLFVLLRPIKAIITPVFVSLDCTHELIAPEVGATDLNSF